LRGKACASTILIFDRDEPVARLEGVGGGRRDGVAADDRLMRLKRTGLVRRATRPLSLERLRAAAPRPKASVLDALLEERRSGR